MLIGITLTGVGASVAIRAAPTGELTGATRGVLVGGVVVALLAISAVQPTLAPDERAAGTRTPVLLCVVTALVLAALAFLELGAIGQFAVLVLGLVVPVVYGTRRVFGSAS